MTDERIVSEKFGEVQELLARHKREREAEARQEGFRPEASEGASDVALRALLERIPLQEIALIIEQLESADRHRKSARPRRGFPASAPPDRPRSVSGNAGHTAC